MRSYKIRDDIITCLAVDTGKSCHTVASVGIYVVRTGTRIQTRGT